MGRLALRLNEELVEGRLLNSVLTSTSALFKEGNVVEENAQRPWSRWEIGLAGEDDVERERKT